MVVLYHYNFKSQSDGISYDMLTFYTSQIKGVSTCTVEHINPAKSVNKYKLSHSYHTVYLGMAMGSPALQPYGNLNFHFQFQFYLSSNDIKVENT